MKEFRLPDPGEGLVEAEIMTWRVAVGDEVKINDIVVEIETSKSLVELPSPYAGTVAALHAAEGDIVEVGTSIISIDDGVGASPAAETPTGTSTPAGTATSAGSATPPGAAANSPAGEAKSNGSEDEPIEDGLLGGAAPGGRVAVLVGYGPRTTEAKRRPRKAAPGREFDEEAHEQVADTFSTGAPVSFRSDVRQPLAPASDEPVGAPLPGPGAPPAEPQPGRTALLAKPPVRKLAKDLGVDLASVPGTGVGGVITRSDVEEAAAARASVPPPAARVNRPAELAESPAPSGESSAPPDLLSAPAPPAAPAPAAGHPAPARQRLPGEDIRVPVKGVRKATAEAMVASAFTAPHVTEWVTCDVTETMELMERLRNRRELAGVRLSPLLLVAKAVCLALGESPDLNAHFDADAQEIVLRGTVNLGIAAATPRGLLVPNIKDAQTLSLLELATAISELVSVAKEGRTQPADTAGGTFTLTNVGVFGVDAGTPILNPGETGILCLGTVARRPWVVGSGAEERIEPRWVTTLALSFDHRAVDGEQGSRFLARVAGILSDPGLALLF